MNEGYFAFRSAAVLIVSAAAGQTAPQAQLTVTAVNKVKIARPSKTIEITAGYSRAAR